MFGSVIGKKNRALIVLASTFAGGVFSAIAPSIAADQRLERLENLILPMDCTLGEDCFLQNLPDLDPTTNVIDSYCGTASYDGHQGTDIRVVSLEEMEEGFDVLAVLPGIVSGMRDEMPDRLVLDQSTKKAVTDRECGNGMVIDHGDGLETQYCHLKLGSVAVSPGESVDKGTILGEVGTSGFSAFPHLHFSIRIDGKEVDPNSRQIMGTQDTKCIEASNATPLWNRTVASAFRSKRTALLRSGIAGVLPDHDRLVHDGGPQTATTNSDLTVGWAWFVNLQKGDRIAMVLSHEDSILAQSTSDPIERNQATYSQYMGKKLPPRPGNYRLETAILRNGKPVLTNTNHVVISN